MYVEIVNGYVLDVTNQKEQPIHFNVKYILGGDYVIFNSVAGKVIVSRFRGNIELYTHEFSRDSRYMIAPFFVDETIKVSHKIRDLYDYLKKNFTNFYLEEDRLMMQSYEVTFKTWVDITLASRFTIKVNPDTITNEDVNNIKESLHDMQRVDMLKLHKVLEGRSVFIDREAIGQMMDAGLFDF